MCAYSLKTVKKAVKEKINDWQDKDSAQTRMKWYDRWAKISGGELDENGNYNHQDIDWDNEFVRLEWYLCDPRILMKIGDPKYYAEGLKLIPEDLHETL